MNKNSLVMYRGRAQTSESPMRVQATKTVEGVRMFHVNYHWWREEDLMA